jgi:hypothetical protein
MFLKIVNALAFFLVVSQLIASQGIKILKIKKIKLKLINFEYRFNNVWS